MAKQLTADQVENLASILEGTCKPIMQGLEQMGLDSRDYDELDVGDQLLSQNLECCPVCGWWVESWELSDDEGNCKACDQCEPRKRGVVPCLPFST